MRCKGTHFFWFCNTFSLFFYTFVCMEQDKYDLKLIYAILAGKVSAALNEKIERNLRQYGVDMAADEWTVMNCLWKNDGMTQQELCVVTHRDKPFMSRLVTRMEKHGWVVRVPNMQNRRANRVRVSQRGWSVREKCSFIANKTLKEVLRGLTYEEARICQESLRIVVNNSKG